VWGLGDDGALSVNGATASISQVRASATGAKGGKKLSISNVTGTFVAEQRVFVHQTIGTNAGQWEENYVESTASGVVSLLFQLANSYTTSGDERAQVVVFKQYSTVSLTNNGQLYGAQWNGWTGGIFPIMASGSFKITSGSLTMGGRGFRAPSYSCGYVCSPNFTATGYSGESATGPWTATTQANGAGGGGAQGECGAGGGGGYGTVGNGGSSGKLGLECSNQPATPVGGQAGKTAGDSDTSKLLFMGGAGGGGGGDMDGMYPGRGGYGGGAVILKSPTIDLVGTINLNGAAGSKGDIPANSNCTKSGCGMGGGGGGAGGGAYLHGDTVSLGNNRISVVGGGGGACSCNSYPGGAGGVGRIAVRGICISGTTTPAFTKLNP